MASVESIFRFGAELVGKTLAQAVSAVDPSVSDSELAYAGKGGLGNLVEKFYFGYEPNSSPRPDFPDAGLELKVTPLKLLANGSFAVKERLVCDMINYMEVVDQNFEDSAFFKKSFLMLILFYLHIQGCDKKDLEFIYCVLWQIKDKDFQIIKQDFLTIRDKIRAGKAHLLSEGDTMYLGAVRKGAKGDSPVKQPHSPELANKRAFAFKTSYMRTILEFAQAQKSAVSSNTELPSDKGYELASASELQSKTFDQIVIDKIMRFRGLDYTEIQKKCGVEKINKGKSANYAALSCIFGVPSINKADEILKSGIIVKTIRLRRNGLIKESMSFKNIDYKEVFEIENRTDSEWYEIATSRFLFVIFRESDEIDNKYLLDKAVFWTMHAEDLQIAEAFWLNIRQNVLEDTLQDDKPGTDPGKISHYWSQKDGRKFHVRPKAATSADSHISPVSGESVPRKAYWFNNSYIRDKVMDIYGPEWQKITNKH